MAKDRPEFKIQQWSSDNKFFYIWKTDKRYKKSGGWRLFDVMASVETMMKIITGKR